MYCQNTNDSMNISFAKTFAETAIVFYEIKPFFFHGNISIYKSFEEIREDQTSIFVISDREIPTTMLDCGKQYVFIGIMKQIYKTSGYPFSISTTVTSKNLAQLVVTDALTCIEQKQEIYFMPYNFNDFADGKSLEIVDIFSEDQEASLKVKKSSGVWFCGRHIKWELQEFQSMFERIWSMLDETKPCFMTVNKDVVQNKNIVVIALR